MSESNKNKINHLESKIENMLDKLIETDEEIENNGERISLKFSEDISSSDKDEGEFFEKELFFTSFFQSENDEQKQEVQNNLPLDNSNKQNNIINLNQNIPHNINCIYKNYNLFSLNYFSPNQE